jgi:hypothetical protein
VPSNKSIAFLPPSLSISPSLKDPQAMGNRFVIAPI